MLALSTAGIFNCSDSSVRTFTSASRLWACRSWRRLATGSSAVTTNLLASSAGASPTSEAVSRDACPAAAEPWWHSTQLAESLPDAAVARSPRIRRHTRYGVMMDVQVSARRQRPRHMHIYNFVCVARRCAAIGFATQFGDVILGIQRAADISLGASHKTQFRSTVPSSSSTEAVYSIFCYARQYINTT